MIKFGIRVFMLTISWLISPFKGTLPYLEKQVSGYEAHRTAVSVHVTHNKPPSVMLEIAESKNGAADPYGSRSMTSNALPLALNVCKAVLAKVNQIENMFRYMASAWLAAIF